MPRLIEVADDAAISLAEACDEFSAHGFDPADEESLAHAALALRRLGNNANFLGDLLLDELTRHGDVQDGNSYGPQVVMLGRPEHGNCFLRANIWPSMGDAMVRASGKDTFVLELPHDHNFNFLTLGYFGPGYWSDFYEADYDAIAGYIGEPVALRHIGRQRLEEGMIQLYRAHIDVHAQLPADALSVSVNVVHTGGAQGWLDQYRFDTEEGRVTAILNHGASEAFLRIAVGLGHAEAIDLAHRFGASHPSDRMRIHAFDALASVEGDVAARDALWARAEIAGSRHLAMEAKARRAELVR